VPGILGNYLRGSAGRRRAVDNSVENGVRPAPKFWPICARIPLMNASACTSDAAHHHVDIAAPAPAADEPLFRREEDCLGAVVACELGGIRLDLAGAIPAPYDEPHACRGGSERHRRAGLRFHPRRRLLAAARGGMRKRGT